ncbi:MAG: polysaccharide pyruvyl transferase family protein [Muribaculaceae bacterium]
MNLLRYLKSIVPLEIKIWASYHQHKRRKKLEPIYYTETPRVYFFLSAGCNNLGDVAISIAVNRFLKDTLPEYEIIEMSLYDTLYYIPIIKRVIKKTDIIALVGGGNIGDIYIDIEYYRQCVIRNFHKNSIISFPQSISFSGKLRAKIAQIVYNRHPDLLLMARDSISYNKMQTMFRKCQIVLAPDIVMTLCVEDLGLHSNGSAPQRCGVIVCIRDDWEKEISDCQVSQLLNEIQIRPINGISNMVDVRVPLNQKELFIREHLQKFMSARLIITDRLHGMIFAFVTQTPALFYDNNNKKVSTTYEWIRNCGYVFPAELYNNIKWNNNFVQCRKSILEQFKNVKNIIYEKTNKNTIHPF